jgi:hypothetical protein
VHFVNRSGQTDYATMMSRHEISRARYFAKWYGRLGTWLLRCCNVLLHSKRLARLRRPAPDGKYTDLGASDQPPRIQLPWRCDEFLLLMSLDNRFYLSGGTLGSGDHWTPTAQMFANFSAQVWWYRIYDLSGGGFRELGTWRYACQRHLGHSVTAKAASAAARR